MGVSPQHISKIVKGQENLTLETITKLESALNVILVEVPAYSYKTEIIATPVSNDSSHLKEESVKIFSSLNYSDDWIGESELDLVNNDGTYPTGTYGY